MEVLKIFFFNFCLKIKSYLNQNIFHRVQIYGESILIKIKFKQKIDEAAPLYPSLYHVDHWKILLLENDKNFCIVFLGTSIHACFIQ